MKVSRLLAFGAILWVCAMVPALAEEAGRPVLDWYGSYWRYSLCLRSPEYQPVWKDAKGRENKYLGYQRGWHIGRTQSRLAVGEIPADWAKPDFDDAAWVRKKGNLSEGESWYDQVVRVRCLRGKFEVADPAKVTKLDLDLTYIGGVCVYLNGREIARQHLPAGPLTGDTMAEAYPPEAYAWGIPINKHNYPAGIGEWKAPDAKSERFRKCTVNLDPKLLLKGQNVLALALFRAGYSEPAAKWSYEAMNGYANTPWPHLAVLDLKLKAAPAGAAVAQERPAGVQVWSEDLHRRVVNRDWGEVNAAPVLRIIGARNGTHSGQVVLGTSAVLSGVTASVSGMEQVGGSGKIPAAAIQVRYALSVPLENLPRDRGQRDSYDNPTLRLLAAYGLNGTDSRGWGFGRGWPAPELMAEGKEIALFDQLAEKPPAALAAGSAQPVWVTVKVPKDAPAGQYRGTLTIQAGEARKVEIRLQVMDWALPDGKDLNTFVALHQSIFSACTQYKCAPWSEDHWRYLERSVQALAEVGNDLVIVPLVTGGEAGNTESLVPWVKQGDGYTYDYTQLDRYMELVKKHWGGKVRVVCELGWTNNGKGWEVTYSGVTALEGGKRSEMKLPPPGSDEWKKLFIPFGKAVTERLKAKGVEQVYWGWFYDSPTTVQPLAEALFVACPTVGWARASHNGFGKQPFPKDSTLTNLDMAIRTGREPFAKSGEPVSHQGWKNPGAVLFPRIASAVQAIGQLETPMALRWLPENCLINGLCGFGRLGADYWPPFAFGNWYHPFQNYLLYPGPAGAEGSMRFEALREGLQEAEVRIQLEQTGKDAAEPAKTVLADRIRAIGTLPTGNSDAPLCEYYGGWQERSWDLYAAAAAATGKTAPSAADKAKFFAVPAK